MSWSRRPEGNSNSGIPNAECRVKASHSAFLLLACDLFLHSELRVPHSALMKGPHERLKYDLRRLWECPVCHRHERTPGSVSSRLCMCQMKQVDGAPVVMKLLADGAQRVVPPVVIQHEPLPPLPPLAIEPAVSTVVEATLSVIAPPPPAAEPPADAS